MRDLVCGAPSGVHNQLGCGRSRLVLAGVQDAGVRVGGQHDAGVTELVLDCLEVGVGGVSEGGGAVPEVVQPNRHHRSGVTYSCSRPVKPPKS